MQFIVGSIIINSSILNKIGLGWLDIGYVLIGLLIIIIILIITNLNMSSRIKKLENRMKKFMSGKDAKSLEQDIIGLYEDNKFLKVNVEKNKKDIRNLNKNMQSVFQKYGIVKYDAFHQMGGKLSFSLALLDQENNGFILNSVHSTDGCYTYTKEIINGECKIDLGEEEKQALSIAMAK